MRTSELTMPANMNSTNDSELSELDLHDHLLFLIASRAAFNLGLNDVVTFQSPSTRVAPSSPIALNAQPSIGTTNRSDFTSNLPSQQRPLQDSRSTMETTRRHEQYQHLNEKQKFVIFVKVVFKILEKRNELLCLRKAKAVVAKCARSNRMGDRRYMPLIDVTVTRLRLAVGEHYWAMATNYLKSKA
jgi:hypothetical protein